VFPCEPTPPSLDGVVGDVAEGLPSNRLRDACRHAGSSIHRPGAQIAGMHRSGVVRLAPRSARRCLTPWNDPMGLPPCSAISRTRLKVHQVLVGVPTCSTASRPRRPAWHGIGFSGFLVRTGRSTSRGVEKRDVLLRTGEVLASPCGVRFTPVAAVVDAYGRRRSVPRAAPT